MWLVSCLPRVQKPSNWSLGFSQKELAPVLLSYCVCDKKERAFYFIILLMLPNFSFLKSLRMFYLFILQLTRSLIALHSENKFCMTLVISDCFNQIFCLFKILLMTKDVLETHSMIYLLIFIWLFFVLNVWRICFRTHRSLKVLYLLCCAVLCFA